MSVADEAHDHRTQALYHEQGMGLRIPPGRRPAVLVIDMQNDFCDPDAPTTLWPSIEQTFEPIKQLCTAARERSIPVIYTQGLVAADGSSAGLWRFKQRFHAENRVQIEGTRGAEIIQQLTPAARRPGHPKVEAKCFLPHRSGGISGRPSYRYAALLRDQCKRVCARNCY